MKKNWVFVIGAPASGRICVDMNLINSHPDAHLLPHTDFPLVLYDMLTSVPPDRADEHWEIEVRNRWPIDDDPDSPKRWAGPFGLHRLLDGGLDPITVTRHMCEAVWDELYPDRLVFGDSSQSYCRRHDLLRRIFPEAKFITVRRDLGVNISEYRNLIVGRGLGEDVNYVGRHEPDHFRKHITSLDAAVAAVPDPCLRVDLRSLKTWPHLCSDRILEFCGLDPSRLSDREAVIAEIVRYRHLDCPAEEVTDANPGLLGLR